MIIEIIEKNFKPNSNQIEELKNLTTILDQEKCLKI